MKTYHSTLMALIFIMGLSACQPSNNKHQELINWLDSNEHTFALDKGMSEDSAIIRILTSISDFNQQASKSIQGETKKGDAVDYLDQAEDFNNFLSQKAILTRKIPLDTARIFHTNYLLARDRARDLPQCPDEIKLDNTQAILLSFPQFMKAATQAFNLQGIDWSNPTVWPSKSFLIYLSNYGVKGRDGIGTNKFQSSAILQFAKADFNTPADNDWIVLANELYNFGELKPPKIIISNPPDAPQVLQTLGQ